MRQLLTKLFGRRPERIRDFPCHNWAGPCHHSCGYCEDNGLESQQWVYRDAPPQSPVAGQP